MPITVDDAFLQRLIAALTDIANQVVACPGGPIQDAKVLAGYAIPSGESLEGAVTNQGGATYTILADMGTQANERGTELSAFIDLTNSTEDWATKSAADFGADLPDWVPGGESDSNSG
jgi:hypothetical protein